MLRNRFFSPPKKRSDGFSIGIAQQCLGCFGFDPEAARKAKRIASGEKEKRDMLIHLLWKRGGLTNQEIGFLSGVTYATVGKVVSAFGGRVQCKV